SHSRSSSTAAAASLSGAAPFSAVASVACPGEVFWSFIGGPPLAPSRDPGCKADTVGLSNHCLTACPVRACPRLVHGKEAPELVQERFALGRNVPLVQLGQFP